MTVKSKMLFVFIGDDKTGKTTLQKMLIEKLTAKGWYDSLKTNLVFDITHPEIKRKYKTISFGNRSYQEKQAEYYKTVDGYFQDHFSDADIAFISSHLVESDVREMIAHGRRKFFNVTGIFWSNSISLNPTANQAISLLDWNERLVIENPHSDKPEQINEQLNRIADSIIFFLANRTSIS